ncbi:MAG: hypothetical protein IKE28_06735 [Solobacterium sp.]|nr:hypothetical protein [Solobacterium sp.]
MAEEKHGYWKHTKIKSDQYVVGYYYARECKCSNCGSISMYENQKCSFCGAVMDLKEPKE